MSVSNRYGCSRWSKPKCGPGLRRTLFVDWQLGFLLGSMTMNSRAAVAESRAAVSVSEVVFRRNPRTEEFEYVSASVEHLTGFTAEGMCRLGLPEILSRVHPLDCPRMAGAIEAISAGGRATIEYRFQHKDGIYRWIAEDTECLCNWDGVPLDRFGFLRDITEEKGIAECAGASTELFVSEAEHAQGWGRGA